MGDPAHREKDGHVFIVGLEHDMVVTDGENVFAFEVENALSQNLKLLDWTVFGVPEPKWDEVVA